MNDTVTFEQAKALHEVGVSFPKTYWVWLYGKVTKNVTVETRYRAKVHFQFPDVYTIYDCPSAADLADRLPSSILYKGRRLNLEMSKRGTGWFIFYLLDKDGERIAFELDLTSALYQAILWCKENSYLEEVII